MRSISLAHARHFMAQRFQQSPHAIVAFRRPHQRGHQQPVRQILRQIVEHLIARRLGIRKQFFHQVLVVIGELFQHLEARFAFAILDLARKLDHFAFRMCAIDKGAFQREIHKSRHHIVFPDRYLAQQQRLVARILQHGEQRAQASARFVDLVHKQEMRNVQIVEPLQIGLQHLHLGGLRLAHHHRRIDAGQDIQRVLQKFDGAGAIEKGETFTEISCRRAIHFHAHLAGARFGARIAHRVFLGNGAFPVDSARRHQKAFQQRRLSAAVRSDQGHCAWPISSSGFWHKCLLTLTNSRGDRGAAGAFPKGWAASRAPLEPQCSRRSARSWQACLCDRRRHSRMFLKEFPVTDAAPKPRDAHPVLFLILFLPLGITNGYVVVTLSYILSHAGVGVGAIAALVAWSLFPQTWKVVWAPIVDATLNNKLWFLLSAIVIGAGMIATALVPATLDPISFSSKFSSPSSALP